MKHKQLIVVERDNTGVEVINITSKDPLTPERIIDWFIENREFDEEEDTIYIPEQTGIEELNID